MNQLLSIVDDALVIKKLCVQTLDGPIDLTNDLRIQGNLKVQSNVSVNGIVTVDTLKVKNLITSNNLTPSGPTEYTFVAKSEDLLVGKGLTFADSTGAKQFVYREGNKMYSSMNIDLKQGNGYQINGLNVITYDSLGPSISNSNLKKVGKLKELTVDGPVVFDDWIFFNNSLNRLGINTEVPNGTVGVLLENNAEFIIDSYENVSKIGNITCNDLDIITDNRTRLTIKQTGDIIVGSEKFKNAVVKINGKLIVDELITGKEDAPLLPIIFRTTANKTIADTGFLWQHEDRNRQFTYAFNPDRIVSTEIIDLHRNRYFSINGSMVLSSSTLGVGITESYLEKVGTLRDLTVRGHSNLGSTTVNLLESNLIQSKEEFQLSVDNFNEISIKHDGDIIIGNPINSNRNLELNGQVEVKGGLKINNHYVGHSKSIPTTGHWNIGDIIFSESPTVNGFVGWVCIETGIPGRWSAFGQILPDRK